MEALAVSGQEDVIGTEEKGGDPIYASIRDYWDWAKTGLEEILAENAQLTFIPEDVFASCVSGQAHFWVAPEGFVITSREVDEFTNDQTFLFWLAWAEERGQSCVIKYYSFFEQVARDAGYKKIEVRTAVNALEPYLLTEGWTKETVVYTRKL
jgi:hypothetical protein